MILLLFLFGLALGAVIPPDDQRVKLQRRGCPTSWYNFNGRCYKYIRTLKTWFGAQVHCASMGANLVSIHSSHEQNFVNALIRSFDPSARSTWIGFSDTSQEGRWTWSDGSEVNYVCWSTGEPNGGTRENCGLTSWGSSFRWNDISCSYSYPSVCRLR
ncbi:ladderlectin-like [Acanthochromis polyacanthus]|uniref:ladderlectin-like n=1 Tax=Acanthochromis polyacanthus TaxID=80966 RepID=UPI0022341D6D|nr:ladderlectin-like [Acanthochromis polyacanthus]